MSVPDFARQRGSGWRLVADWSAIERELRTSYELLKRAVASRLQGA